MRVPFRQGIVQYKHPAFIQVEFPYAHLLADVSNPLILNIAAGQTDYLHAEKANVPQAWGPLAVGVDVWLYVDIDRRTAQRTFGTTTLEPISGATIPIYPAVDQHWFDTTTNEMKVWSGTNWISVIRVFACLLQSGQVPISMSINSPNFAGTQVGNLNSVSVGYIIFDTNNNPIKTSNDSFITSEDSLRVNSLSASDVKVGSLVVEAIAQESIPAFSIVEFADFGKIITASTFVTSTRKQYGIIQQSVVPGEAVNVVIDGPLTNSNWDWSSLGVNAYLYNDSNGQLVSTPAIPEQSPVAIVIDTHSIMLLVKVVITNLPPSLSTTTISGTVKLATPPASPANPVAVGDNDPRLTDFRAPLDHEHPISDVIDLQTTLDDLSTTKFDKTGGTLTGPLSLYADPTAPLEAVTKQYVDTVINELFWQKPILDTDLVNDSLNIPPTPLTSQVHIVGNAPTGVWSGLARHAVSWNGVSWVDLLGRSVQIGDRFGICMEFASSPGGSFVGRDNYIAEIIGINAGNITYNFIAPTKGIAVFVDGNQSSHFGDQYSYNGTDWVELSGTSELDDNIDVTITSPVLGQALTFDGTKWINATPVSALSGLSDVQLSTTTTGEFLTYNGSKWVNSTLPTVNSTPGSYGSTTQIPTFTVNNKGLVTSASNVSISTDINDLVPDQTGNVGKVLTTSGSVVSWGSAIPTETLSTVLATGDNYNGKLGIGNTDSKLVFTPLGFDQTTQVRSIGGGLNHTMLIKEDNTLWAWGENTNGRLGVGNTVHRSSPVQVGSLATWDSVSTGAASRSSGAISTDGSLWTWGRNSQGQLGIGDTTARSSPVQMGSIPITIISGGGQPMSEITNDQRVDITGFTVSTTPTVGTLSDGSWLVNIPFNINILGETKNTVYINTALSVTFDAEYLPYWSYDTDPIGPIIILGIAPKTATSVTYGTLDSAPNRRFVVRYDGDSGNEQYELVFYEAEPGRITIHLGYANSIVNHYNPCRVYSSTHDLLSSFGAFDPNPHLYNHYLGIELDMAPPGVTVINNTIHHDWKQISTGRDHMSAVKTDGTLWTWGDNYDGQLGQGNLNDLSSPVQVGTNTNWKYVASGSKHTVALKTNGTLWAGGYNYYGQLGDSTSSRKSSPIQIGTNTDWETVACGNSHTAALKTNGTLWTWGDNYRGQLGDGTRNTKSSPIQIGTETTWSHVWCGYTSTFARKDDGSLWGWGENYAGQLGTNNTTRYSSPVQIGSLTTWSTYLHSGVNYTISGTSIDKTYLTDINVSGGTTGLTTSGGPIYKSGTITLDGILSVTNGGTGSSSATDAFNTLAPSQAGKSGRYLTTNGTSAVWAEVVAPAQQMLTSCGSASSGLLGNGTNTAVSTPVAIGAHGDWTKISVDYGAHAIKSNGTLWAWGTDAYGQLGVGTNNTHRSSPVQVGSLNNWKQVSHGSNHVTAVKTDGTIWSWGRNNWGQLGLGDYTTRSSPVQIGSATNWVTCSSSRGTSLNRSFFINSLGQMFGVGWNNQGFYGSRNLGIGNTGIAYYNTLQQLPDSDWASVVCGADHAAALKIDGTLWCWGDNYQGQCGSGAGVVRSVPTQVGADTWKQVSTGGNFTVGIKSNGTLWCWGSNSGGQLGLGYTGSSVTVPVQPTSVSTHTDWKYVEANGSCVLAIKNDGSLWAWGSNTGMWGNGTTTSVYAPTQVGNLSQNYVTLSHSGFNVVAIVNPIGPPMPGVANTVLGMSAGANSFEYKTIAAGTNITVTHTGSTITIAGSAGAGVTTATANTLTQRDANADIYANNFISSSDIKLKENIRDIKNPLGVIMSLVGHRFNFIDTQREAIGFIAQEMEEILPELVHESADGIKSVNYPAVIAILVEAVKELESRINSIDSKNE
ncbi:MAG: hypothetical protein CTY12_04665 [Methylotenera sp.]|nr:MAG: hypothetical protein CTY12_04665 [Methylotenera sp.]